MNRYSPFIGAKEESNDRNERSCSKWLAELINPIRSNKSKCSCRRIGWMVNENSISSGNLKVHNIRKLEKKKRNKAHPPLNGEEWIRTNSRLKWICFAALNLTTDRINHNNQFRTESQIKFSPKTKRARSFSLSLSLCQFTAYSIGYKYNLKCNPLNHFSWISLDFIESEEKI